MSEFSLEMKGIAKHFPGVQALAGVDFNLRPGEVHALLGINGAGKSTLIKILAGIYQKDSGSIRVHGESVDISSPLDARANGIATVYQDPQMIPSFTGYENIFLGSETASRSVFSVINRRDLRKRSSQLLQRFPFQIDLSRPVYEMETVEKETIAVLRALSQERTSILVLDEPTSILTRNEISVLFDQISILKKQGISIVYITHRLDEVFQVADRFTVLRDGRTVGTYGVRDKGIDSNRITELMLGEKLNQVFPGRGGKPGDEVLRVEALTLAGKFNDVSIHARKGEIVGIFGLVGSGFDELCKSMFGVLKPDAGSMRLAGTEIRPQTPEEAVNLGIFLIPGDRRVEGQISDESIAFNTTLANLDKIAGFLGLIRPVQEKRDTSSIVDTLKIKTTGTGQKVALLSGGNQQKVVIGKGLYTDSQVYLFEEPTVGVDVGAKSGIYHLIRDLARDHAVIVASSDCEEIFGLCDRVLVMYKGRVVLDKPVTDSRLDELLLFGLTGGKNGKN